MTPALPLEDMRGRYQEMSLELHYFEVPECPLRSYSDSIRVEIEERVTIPVDIITDTDVKCVAQSRSGRLSLRCDLLSYRSDVKRIRDSGRNILEVDEAPNSTELIKAVFQTARDLGCDHVHMHILDLVSCI